MAARPVRRLGPGLTPRGPAAPFPRSSVSVTVYTFANSVSCKQTLTTYSEDLVYCSRLRNNIFKISVSFAFTSSGLKARALVLSGGVHVFLHPDGHFRAL